MEIRLANTSDIPGIIALLRQVGQVHHDIRPDLFRAGAQKYSVSDLEELRRYMVNSDRTMDAGLDVTQALQVLRKKKKTFEQKKKKEQGCPGCADHHHSGGGAGRRPQNRGTSAGDEAAAG